MSATQPLLRAVPQPAEAHRSIASSVQALAAISGVDHAHLASLVDMDPTALSKALRCKRKFSGDEIAKLATALDVPVQILFDGGEAIRRRARAGVLTPDADGPDTPPGLGILPRGCNGDVLSFRARRTVAPAVAHISHQIAS